MTGEIETIKGGFIWIRITMLISLRKIKLQIYYHITLCYVKIADNSTYEYWNIK